MNIISVECTCIAEQEYVDGSTPSFYTDIRKAVYMFKRLSAKSHFGQARVQEELIIDEMSGECSQGLKPLSSLREYNMFFGVHLDGLHILSIRD